MQIIINGVEYNGLDEVVTMFTFEQAKLQAENDELKGLIKYYKAQIVELKKKIKSQKETLRYYRKKPTVFKNWV